MLTSLKLHGIGPVSDLSASFGERLNIFTGDNGLGKSFLLDMAFWALTGTWPGGRTAIPDGNYEVPAITYNIQSKTKPASREAKYDFKSQSWNRRRGRPPMPGLVIYAAVDGSFAVWDPARNYWRDARSSKDTDEWPRAFQFPPQSSSEYDDAAKATIRRDVANGLEEGGRVLCNGLIADWSEWFYQRASTQSSIHLNTWKKLCPLFRIRPSRLCVMNHARCSFLTRAGFRRCECRMVLCLTRIGRRA